MKLITEVLEEKLSYVIEEDAKSGKKNFFIEGIFAQADVKNRNGRLYPGAMLGEKIQSYTENYVNKNRGYGELGHPSGPTINGDRICMMIKELKQDGGNYIGKALVTTTPMGEIVKGILGDGGQWGVSTRGMGSLRDKNGVNEVQNDFVLKAVDVVTDPSAPEAFVNGIMEGVDWLFDDKTKHWYIAERYQEEMKKMTAKDIRNNKFQIFESFIHNLAKS